MTPPTADELIDAVEDVLGALSPMYSSSAAESDLYEASLLTVAASACASAGGNNTLDGAGTTAGQLRFRKSPGQIWVDDYTRVTSTFHDGRALEIHLGVRLTGKSGVLHEADVVVLDSMEALRCRAAAVPPRHSKAIAIIEAKHYEASPGLGIGRSFLGLGLELEHAKTHLAFPEPGSAELKKLIAKRTSQLHDQVWPGSPSGTTLSEHIRQAALNWYAAG